MSNNPKNKLGQVSPGAGDKQVQPAIKIKKPELSTSVKAIIEQLEKDRAGNVTNHKALLSKLEVSQQDIRSSTKEITKGLQQLTNQLYGYSEGYTKGYGEGFAAGIKDLVKATEEEMAREMKLASREELVGGKLPTFWIICLVKNLKYLIPRPQPSHLKTVSLLRKELKETKDEQEPKANELTDSEEEDFE